MYYPDAQHTALLISLLLKRLGKSRARMSRETLKLLAARQQLRHRFLVQLETALDDFGWVLIELETSGFGLVAMRALEGAPRCNVRILLSSSERQDVVDGEVDWETVEAEVFDDTLD